MNIRIRKRMGDTPTVREKEKQGFTLTEIAIVLGIIGLILGAIWVAAAAVYQNLRVSKATTELLDITQNIRALYATSSTVDPLSNMTVTGAQTGGALTYINAGVFPADMVSTLTSVLNPWNGYTGVAAAQTNAANDSFIVTFDGVPQTACVTMLVGNTGNGRDPAMVEATATAGAGPAIAAGATLATNLTPGTPLAASVANTACTGTAAVGNSVSFAFKLRG